MGPPDLRTLVTRQTDQITSLKSQLEASVAYNAKLRTRLVNALETLDTLQAELDAERRNNDKHMWMNLIQGLQREKDEMKDVVELLIKKVERSKGNFGRWPSATMYLPIPAGRSIGFVDLNPPPVTPPRTEALLHALAFERKRYKQASEALHNAHETVLTLEAQVARREAELENQDRQYIVDAQPIPQKRSLLDAFHPDLPEVSISDVVSSLSIAEEHNLSLEMEVYELNSRRLKESPRFTSTAVQTSPPSEIKAVGSALRLPATPPPRTRLTRRGGVTNPSGDIQVLVGELSDAIDRFQAESRSVQDTLKLRKRPTDISSNPPLANPSSALGDDEVSPTPHPPPEYQLPPEPQPPSPQKTQPNFQHILRVERECVRLTRVNERLERELSELRRTATSPISRASSVSFIRSPASHTPALPAVSPSAFSVRSSGERDMDISSTPLHRTSTFPEEDRDHNHLSDIDLFLGHTHPPAPENSSMNAEPSGGNQTHFSSQGSGNGDSTNRPSSAPPNIDDTHRPALLSPFQLSASLPPRSKSIEPSTGGEERIREVQRELEVASEDLANKSENLNELRELVDRLKDQVT